MPPLKAFDFDFSVMSTVKRISTPWRKAKKPLCFLDMPPDIILEICNHMDCVDMSRLGRTSKGYHQFMERILYRKSIALDSHCIYWASSDRKEDTATFEDKRHMLRLARQYGGDINTRLGYPDLGQSTTALHLAAACGMTPIVKDLIEYGARVDAISCNFITSLFKDEWESVDSLFEGFGTSLSQHLTDYNAMWLPMLIPIMTNKHDIVKMLNDARAPGAVTKKPTAQGPRNGLTIHHAIGTLRLLSFKQEDYDMYRAMMTRHAALSSRVHGITPLHIAIRNANMEVAQTMLEMGHDVDAQDYQGRTPLTLAIQHYSTVPTLIKRNDLERAVDFLLNRDVDVNVNIGRVERATPLVTCMLPTVRPRWSWSFTGGLRGIIYRLYDHGADLNGRSLDGDTILHQLIMKLVYTDSDNLRKLLTFIVTHGADINSVMGSNGRTPMYHCIRHAGEMPAANFKTVWVLGAKIDQHEADDSLLRWTQQPKLRNEDSGYDVLKYHRPWITPAVAWHALKIACRSEDMEMFSQLEANYSITDASELIAISLEKEKNPLYHRLSSLPFRCDFKGKSGMSYLHIIIDRLRRSSGSSSQKVAMDQVYFFLRVGTSTLILDSDGKQVIQRLRELPFAYPRLLLTLYDARETEMEAARDARDNVQQEAVVADE